MKSPLGKNKGIMTEHKKVRKKRLAFSEIYEATDGLLISKL